MVSESGSINAKKSVSGQMRIGGRKGRQQTGQAFKQFTDGVQSKRKLDQRDTSSSGQFMLNGASSDQMSYRGLVSFSRIDSVAEAVGRDVLTSRQQR